MALAAFIFPVAACTTSSVSFVESLCRSHRFLLSPLSQVSFVESLCRSHSWSSGGGKSGASFARTWDGRFVVKHLSRTEKQSFLQFAPQYFEHLAQAATDPHSGDLLRPSCDRCTARQPCGQWDPAPRNPVVDQSVLRLFVSTQSRMRYACPIVKLTL